MAAVGRVLIVEDESDMQVILRDNLQFEGYEVVAASSGEEALAAARQERLDLVLLDLMLPRMSGYEVCRKLRGSGLRTPIIMLSARNAEMDRVTGLELGADDYIGKPFSIRELLSRIRVQLRRGDALPPSDRFEFGDVVVSLTHREVRRRSRRLTLSAKEFDVLRYLIAHRGQIVTREQLLNDVWGYTPVNITRTVDNSISKLRQKIEPDPHRPMYVLTIHGSGYRFLC